MQELTENQTWVTDNLPLASYLRFKGFITFHFRFTKNPYVECVFPLSDPLLDAVAEWESGQADTLKLFASVHDGTFRQMRQFVRASQGSA